MKAIILCAGKGTRMRELTADLPKPLLSIRDKTLLEFKIQILPEEITEVILVIGYLGDKIKEKIGSECYGKKITYVEAEPLGTAYCLFAAKDLLTERFLLMYGDDLYSRKDVIESLKHRACAGVFKKEGEMSGGKMILDEQDYVLDIQEGKHADGGLISTGLFVFSPVIFNYPLQKMPGREEYGVPPTIVQALAEMPLKALHASAWKQISAPEDLYLTDEEYEQFAKF
jgi:NDP-sugar pyrophosphorylase family protein